jgi:hypothetical protein
MRKFMVGLLILMVSSFFAFFIYETYFAARVFINPLEFAEFNKSIPAEYVKCESQANIEFYHYKTVVEEDKKNNKFGLYIYPDNEKFIELADKLVNSNGGDWGYVLLPYNVQDDDKEKWDRVFYLLNKKHLIPIVQLYNVDINDWKDQTKDAVKFLNKFHWPIKQRYISVYNEPNDSRFWYETIDPEQYSRVLDYTIDKFKDSNENFFMLNGALNISASNVGTTMDAFDYMDRMNKETPGIFNKIDGWASHSYPQPNFGGSPYDTGRYSIQAYDIELEYLKNEFGVDKDLPVFITETGWMHDVGKNYEPAYLSIKKVGEYFEIAYKEVWLPDDRVVAVTPFTIWYEPPADHFAWIDSRWVPYGHFEDVRSMKKVSGNPENLTLDNVSSIGCP